MSLSEKLIDKRVLRRTLERGVVSRSDYEQYLSQLPDMSSNIQKSDTSSNEADLPARTGDGPF